MIVAILTNTLSTLPQARLSRLNWLDDVLSPSREVLYVLFFIWLICSGPGKFQCRLLAPPASY